MPYLVLIGDLIASRKSPQRQDLQLRLKSVLKRLNQQTPGLASPYTLTLGDEFQAVFTRADTVFVDMVQILAALHPDQARFALGLGEITTDLNPEQALGMDGPAFYHARDGIEHLKTSGELFTLEGLPDTRADLAVGSLSLLGNRVEKWEANRLAILHGLLTDRPVKDIARELGISEQAVYKNINNGGLKAVLQVLTALAQLLNDCLEQKP